MIIIYNINNNNNNNCTFNGCCAGIDTATIDGLRITRANSRAGRASRTGNTGTGAGSRRKATTTSTGGTDISLWSQRDSGGKCSGDRPRAGQLYKRRRWFGRDRAMQTAGWSPRARFLTIRRRTGDGNTGNTGNITNNDNDVNNYVPFSLLGIGFNTIDWSVIVSCIIFSIFLNF